MSAVATGSRRLGWGSARYLLIGAAAVFLLLYPVFSDNLYYQNMIILSTVLAVGAVSWNVISGYAGYVSLGQSAFFGIGAYTLALFSLKVNSSVSPFWWVPAAGAVAAVSALVFGIVLMRTRGHSFVILTIALLFLAQLLIVNLSGLTNGAHGLTLPLPQWSLDYQYWPFYYSLLGILALAVAMSWWIRRTKFGMGLVAIREDEDKAGTVGVNTSVYKLLGFVASAVWMGCAGGIYAYYLTFIDPRGMFDIVISVQVVLAAILGGRGTLWGPVLGAFIIEPLFETTNNQLGGGNWRLVLSGGLMALVVLFLPSGILPSLRELWRRRTTAGRAALVGARVERGLTTRERAPAPAPAADAPPLLEVKGVSKSFGGLRAVDECGFTVPQSSITALIGPNGSGKTTLFNVVTGMMRADAGEVWLEGRRIDRLSRWQRAYLGLGRTFQITRLFRQMTVLENVVAPLKQFSWGDLGADAVRGEEAERAMELLDFVGMKRFAGHPASDLSYGQQKLVELAQVLMLDPKLIMLDEPAGGINPTLIGEIVEMIHELNRQGKTFLIVEHNMPVVLSLCDPVLVLARGTCICRGTPQEIQADPAVLDAYLGEDFSVEAAARGVVS